MFLYWLEITPPTTPNKAISFSAPTSSTGMRTDNALVSPTPPSLFALLIGIDNYKHCSDTLKNLHGAMADADAVKSFLCDTLHVPKDQIKTLQNEDTTRYAIEMEIKNLGSNPEIKKDDPILIFYAGHRGETPRYLKTPDSSEKIQMLVPHDFIPGGSGNAQEGQGILDKKLSRLLQDLAEKKSDNIMVILDCCHSGSGTRTHDSDPNFTVHGIDLPKTYTIAEDLLCNIESDPHASAVANGFGKAGLLSYVLLAACKQGQEAREEYGHGTFTKALLDLLQEKGIDKLTYKDIVANLHSLPKQDLQCEGVHQSQFIFNSKVTSSPHVLYTINTSSDPPGQYILDAGEAHGITKNAEFNVFPDKSMTSTVLGTAVAVETATFTMTCMFSLRDGEMASSLPGGIGYALQTRVSDSQDVCLFIEKDERLLGIFKQIADEMESRKAGKRGSADFYWHLHRSSEKSPLTKMVELECRKLTETGNYTDNLDEILKPDGHNLNIEGVISVDVGEEAMYGFKVKNKLAVALYVSMFYFDVSDLSITPYYQLGSAQKDADASLPPKGSLDIGYSMSGIVPYSYTLRQGQDIDVGFLKLFFSTKHMDLSGLVQGSPFENAGHLSSDAQKRKAFEGWHVMHVAIVQKKGGHMRFNRVSDMQLLLCKPKAINHQESEFNHPVTHTSEPAFIPITSVPLVYQPSKNGLSSPSEGPASDGALKGLVTVQKCTAELVHTLKTHLSPNPASLWGQSKVLSDQDTEFCTELQSLRTG
ncbi:hypothetical protein IW262DRAFT_1300651 [Armillaria fumosa]|nr:hypothetical protein IW262DRAFT_1300651 [Armillaria fumosa]